MHIGWIVRWRIDRYEFQDRVPCIAYLVRLLIRDVDSASFFDLSLLFVDLYEPLAVVVINCRDIYVIVEFIKICDSAGQCKGTLRV